MGANWPVGPISHGTAEMAPPTGFAWRHIEDQIGDKMPNHLLYSEFLLMFVMAIYCQCQNGEAVQALLLMVFYFL